MDLTTTQSTGRKSIFRCTHELALRAIVVLILKYHSTSRGSSTIAFRSWPASGCPSFGIIIPQHHLHHRHLIIFPLFLFLLFSSSSLRLSSKSKELSESKSPARSAKSESCIVPHTEWDLCFEQSTRVRDNL